jgi:5'-methylthioadenosine phosphorylase
MPKKQTQTKRSVARGSAPRARIGIIGGSGLYEMETLKEVQEVSVTTPFGRPSGKIILGTLEGRPVAFLARHGLGHTLLPSEVNYRANIFAFKKLGVERILSVSAVGIMQEHIAPGHIVVPDQFYDLTKGRESTFFGRGVVAHVSLADPICKGQAEIVSDAAERVGATVHRGGTYLCMEGPQFSTRAESHIHRSWGAGGAISVIGMTNATEAKLAREAEICYTTLALATDYDCWHVAEADVTVDQVLKALHDNVALSKRIIQAAVGQLPMTRDCGCGDALKYAIVTAPNRIPAKTRTALAPIIGKYL